MSDTNYRWFILILTGLTATLVVAMPAMAMPVLFAEMSEDLGLSLVQIGAVWGIGSLGGLLTGLAGGAIGDRFGPRLTLTSGCAAVGVTGALIGLSTDFAMLVITVLLNGLVASAIPMNLHKVCGVWFSGKRLGMANGVVSAGMALGFMTRVFDQRHGVVSLARRLAPRPILLRSHWLGYEHSLGIHPLRARRR